MRNAKIRYADDPEICPARAWIAYRTRLAAEHGESATDPSAPAFVGIDRWGHLTGGMGPDSVTRAIKRISRRAGMPIAWTGRSLCIGLASVARHHGKDSITIADQGGWARHSRSMLHYMQINNGWNDNASAGAQSRLGTAGARL
ncbi:hypothetical protein ACWDGI_41940 [Streptomyces sp. NPDC001220]